MRRRAQLRQVWRRNFRHARQECDNLSVGRSQHGQSGIRNAKGILMDDREGRDTDVSSRKTARLSLRQPEMADAGFLTELFSRHELVAHRPDTRPDSPQQSAERLDRDMAHWVEHGFGRWAILAKGNLVGFGGVTVSKQFEGLNLSYHLHPHYWGRGFATELVVETVRFAFENLGAPRIIGLVRTANTASVQVLQRCGFQFEQEVMLAGAPTNLYALKR